MGFKNHDVNAKLMVSLESGKAWELINEITDKLIAIAESYHCFFAGKNSPTQEGRRNSIVI